MKKRKNKSSVEFDKKRENRIHVGILSFIFLFSFFLYANTLNHEYVVDDPSYISANRFVQEGINGIPKLFTTGSLSGYNGMNTEAYRPILLSSFAIEVHFFGNNPYVGHLVNILLYAISCIVLFLLLKKLFEKYNILIPLLTTLLFIAHPIHTEVVANIKSRDEILSFLGLLLTLYFLIQYINAKGIKYLIYSVLMFFVSLLTKENAITFLAIIPLTLYFFTDLNLKRIFVLVLPFMGVTIIYLFLRLQALDGLVASENIGIVNNSLLAAKSASDKYATILYIMGKYLKLLILPHPLTWDYSYAQIPIKSWLDIGVVFSVVIHTALLLYALINVSKKQIFAFCILFYFIGLSITSNVFVDISATMAERFLYIPSLGFCLLMAILILRLLKINNTGNIIPKRPILIGVLSVVLVSYSFKTVSRNSEWKDNLSIFLSGAKHSPNSARAHFTLGSEYYNQALIETNPGRQANLIKKAAYELKKTVSIYRYFSDAWTMLGVIQFQTGDVLEAEISFLNAVKASPNNNFALKNTGIFYASNRDFDKAESYLSQAISANKHDAESFANLGHVYFDKGNYDLAILNFTEAIGIKQDYLDPINSLARLYLLKGDTAQADYYFQWASKISR